MHELLEKIRLDPRHRNLRVLLEERVVKRQFSHWAMGLVRRDDKADEMREMYRAGGCVDDAHARRLIDTLLSSAP